MKKLLSLAVISLMFTAISSTSAQAESVYGAIYKNAQQPGGGSGSVAPYKQGEAVCRSFFGIVALGDCSINKAMENGKVKSLSHYDEHVRNILGYKTVKVVAYGQ